MTTATNQHINIFVPEDPEGKVMVEKTQDVKIVEDDSDNEDAKGQVKKAIGEKIRSKLVKKVLGDSDGNESESSGDSDDANSRIRSAQKRIDAAKKKSHHYKSAMDKHTDRSRKHHSRYAQTDAQPLTENEILALAAASAESEVDEAPLSDSKIDLAQSDMEVDETLYEAVPATSELA